MKEGDVLTVRFEAIAPRGDGIAPVPEGPPIYASNVLPGEEARVRVRKVRRNWAAVDVEAIVTPSPDRVTPPCPLYAGCSGCQLQHVAYPRQLELKREMIREAFQRFGGFDEPPIDPVLGAEDPWHYRNHARFTARDGKLGYVRRFKRQWFEVPSCAIMKPEINRLLGALSGHLPGATQCNIRVGSEPEQVMIQPRLPQAPLEVATGQTELYEMLHGRAFRVSAASFFQVNPAQAERLIDVVRELIGPRVDTVVDAYAGVGTFAVMLADRARRVIAIEESGPAVEDAKVNVAGLDNVQLLLGKSEELLGTLEGPIDAVILDPPRSGCRPQAIAALRQFRPERLLYVSCDPGTLARDLALLVEGGAFVLDRVQPIDMFPQTHHVECVALLRRSPPVVGSVARDAPLDREGAGD